MIPQSEFLVKYGITGKEFAASGIKWEDLELIYDDYLGRQADFEPTAKLVVECLQKVDEVHSLKFRLKNPEHLIEKLLRKRKDDHSFEVNVQSYCDKITDLIGVRALHLFKEDWARIHDFIVGTWNPAKPPIAYVRKGDPEGFLKPFVDKGCKIEDHKFSYRSVHYVVESSPTTRLHRAEIQVRTIFEEGWSEIDHKIRYPYDIDNPLLAPYLMILNRLAGAADEMGWYARFLKNQIECMAQESEKELAKKDAAIRDLHDQIAHLKVEQDSKDRLKKALEAVSWTAPVQTWQTVEPSGGHDTSKLLEELVHFLPRKCVVCGREIPPWGSPRAGNPICGDCLAKLGLQ